jgi:hypothetical protein
VSFRRICVEGMEYSKCRSDDLIYASYGDDERVHADETISELSMETVNSMLRIILSTFCFCVCANLGC